jgi:4-cresol dehydrogenase (hydroxylating) flavoprotein subunit
LGHVRMRNHYRILGSLGQLRKHVDPGKHSLSKAQSRVWYRALRLPFADWRGSLTVTGGSRNEVRARLQTLRARLRPLASEFVPTRISGAVRQGSESTADDLLSVYWRKSQAPTRGIDADPDRDRCGVLFVCPVVPLLGREIQKVVRLISKHTIQRGFEPSITLRTFNERCAELITLLTFDREVPSEDQRALECHDSLVRMLVNSGYIPYRLTLSGMELLPSGSDDTVEVTGRIKRALDPGGLFSRGRYVNE